jgi:ADP-ribosyl-[dinitrogen reductase] hydrolase
MSDAGFSDRARGAFLGLAVGDALGTTLEFSVRDTQPRHTEMIGGGPFRLQPGVWTDDTSMAVALANSLVHCRGFDPADLMARFLRWMDHGEYSPTGHCFDIGTTTRQALGRFRGTGDPFAGPTAEDTAGNGSLMRLAPAVLHAFSDPAACQALAAEQGRTTHGAPQAMDSCRFFADLLRRAITGEARDSVLAPVDWQGHDAVRAVAAGCWRGWHRDQVSSAGYVVDTLAAALWSVGTTHSFEAAVILAVNLADDADTVGAVTGQLAGALYGEAAIPARWLGRVAWRERIAGLADALIGPVQAGDAAR